MKREHLAHTGTRKKSYQAVGKKLQSGDSSLETNVKVDVGLPFPYMPLSIGDK